MVTRVARKPASARQMPQSESYKRKPERSTGNVILIGIMFSQSRPSVKGLGRSESDRDQLPMLAPGHPQAIADLPHGRMGADRREDRRHQVALSTGRRLETVHGVEPALGGALGSDST